MKQTVIGSLDTLLLGPGLTIVIIYTAAEIYASKRATYIMYIMANLAKSAVQRYTQADKYILQPKYSNVPKECNAKLA